MQIIIISSNNAGHKHWHLTRSKLLLLLTVITMIVAYGTISINKWLQSESYTSKQHPSPTYTPTAQSESTPILEKTTSNNDVQRFYAKKLGGLQAEAIRLKVISEKLAKIAGLDTSEFALDKQPAEGGVEELAQPLSKQDFQNGINQLSQAFSVQEKTLSALQQYLITKDSITAAIPSGRPIKHGWISSFFGYRIDPFTGKKAFHPGLDFAGKEGSKIYAVADGIVTWAGKRGGYGRMVEVDHGNGYVTRFGHNEKLEVKVGQRVRRGQVLALMGSTGRSTGPHVHFEILRDGKAIDPYSFVKH